jgi:hypothetical protein
MATLDGVEVAPCERCAAPVGANEYTITKASVESRRVFCDNCAEVTAQTYAVKPIGRKSARASREEAAPAADPSPTNESEKE